MSERDEYREFEEQESSREFSLRDVYELIRRRRVIVASVLIGCILVAIGHAVIVPKEYEAVETLEVERRGPEILEFTDVMGQDPAGYHDYYQTQYRIMQSRRVIELAATQVDLQHHPSFVGRHPSLPRRLLKGVRSIAGMGGGTLDPQEKALRFLSNRLDIEPVRNSHLVRIVVTDRDPQLAAELAASVSAAYQSFQLDARYRTTGEASDFLAKDVVRLQDEIATLEEQLQQHGESVVYVPSQGDGQNVLEEALSSINRQHALAAARVASTGARVAAIEGKAPDALLEVRTSDLVRHLLEEMNQLQRQDADLAQQFGSEWPERVQLQRRLAEVQRQYSRESERIASQVLLSARVDWEEAQGELNALETRRAQEIESIRNLRRDAVGYNNLTHQIATKRRVLEDLVERQSQTEISHRLQETGTSNVRVVDPAVVPRRAASPSLKLNLALGLMLGIGLGCLAAFVVEHLDNNVNSEQDVRRHGQLPTLAKIPKTSNIGPQEAPASTQANESWLDLASVRAPRSGFAEAYRNLRTSMLLASPGHPPRHIVVTSSVPSEGKSTVSFNLALVLTQLGKRVLLIDADLRRPRIHKSLSLAGEVGLSSVLSGNATLAEATQECEIDSLSLLLAGPVPPNPSELLAGDQMEQLLAQVAAKGMYDHVVIDSPPVLSVADGVIVAALADATMLVVRAGKTTGDMLAQSSKNLSRAKARVTGVVLNAFDSEDSPYYQGYYGAADEAEPRTSRFKALKRWSNLGQRRAG